MSNQSNSPLSSFLWFLYSSDCECITLPTNRTQSDAPRCQAIQYTTQPQWPGQNVRLWHQRSTSQLTCQNLRSREQAIYGGKLCKAIKNVKWKYIYVIMCFRFWNTEKKKKYYFYRFWYWYAAFRLACHSLHAALMVIFVQLHKRHLQQKKDQAVSSVKPINW